MLAVARRSRRCSTTQGKGDGAEALAAGPGQARAFVLDLRGLACLPVAPSQL